MKWLRFVLTATVHGGCRFVLSVATGDVVETKSLIIDKDHWVIVEHVTFK